MWVVIVLIYKFGGVEIGGLCVLACGLWHVERGMGGRLGSEVDAIGL
jgi:hypothetical protein